MRVFLIFILSVSCTGLFYQPDRNLYAHPKNFQIEYEELWFENQDRPKLNAWLLKNSDKKNPSKGLIIFFHGNAQNISAHFLALAWLTQYGYDVLISDYRGYGISDGEPFPLGVYQDSLTILNKSYDVYKKNHYKKMIIYGQSLGGAILLRAYKDFLHKDEVSLMVLDSTFLSYKKVAWSVMTGHWITFLFSPLAWVLVSDEYATDDFVSQVTTPTLVIHSKSDRVVSFSHGEEIFNKLTVQKKWFWQLDDIPHIGVFSIKAENRKMDFLKLLEKI